MIKRFERAKKNEEARLKLLHNLATLADWIEQQLGWKKFLYDHKFGVEIAEEIYTIVYIFGVYRGYDEKIYIELETNSCFSEFTFDDLREYFGTTPDDINEEILEKIVEYQNAVDEDFNFLFDYLGAWIPICRDGWREFLIDHLEVNKYSRDELLDLIEKISINYICIEDSFINVDVWLKGGEVYSTKDISVDELFKEEI